MKPLIAVKQLMERVDNVTPNGGRKVTLDEIKAFREAVSPEELVRLGREASALLGETLDEGSTMEFSEAVGVS